MSRPAFVAAAAGPAPTQHAGREWTAREGSEIEMIPLPVSGAR